MVRDTKKGTEKDQCEGMGGIGCGVRPMRDDLVISTYSNYVSIGRHGGTALVSLLAWNTRRARTVSTTPLMGAQRQTSYQITIVWEDWIRTRAAVNDLERSIQAHLFIVRVVDPAKRRGLESGFVHFRDRPFPNID